MPEVSVIIPTYNRAKYIVEALDSIFAQDYDDYEIIVVDDGSTDHTRDALDQWIESQQIHYIYQQNQGESAARNKALSVARGKYITFLDSDDLFSPGKLRIQVAYLEGHSDIRFVHGGYSKFDDQGKYLGFRDVSEYQGRVYPDLLLNWKVLPAVPAVMMHRSLFEQIDGFDESLRHGPDLDLWRRVARVTDFGWVAGEMCRIRVHPGNISADKKQAVLSFERYLQNAFDDDPDLNEPFRRKILARMYANIAQNVLGEGLPKQMAFVRKYSSKAIQLNPAEWAAYPAFLGSLIPRRFRLAMYRVWKQVRYKPGSKGKG